MSRSHVQPVLFSEEAIRSRVQELAEQISRDYAGTRELVLVGVLKGAFIFLADLARRLTIPRSIDFVSVSSYGKGSRASGAVRLVMDVRTNLEGRDVLVVDDILDRGGTLGYLMRIFAARKAASLRSCVLLRKRIPGRAPGHVDYLGFEIPDAWVVGYGLDYAEQHRALPYIGVIEPEDRPPVAGPRG